MSRRLSFPAAVDWASSATIEYEGRTYPTRRAFGPSSWQGVRPGPFTQAQDVNEVLSRLFSAVDSLSLTPALNLRQVGGGTISSVASAPIGMLSTNMGPMFAFTTADSSGDDNLLLVRDNDVLWGIAGAFAPTANDPPSGWQDCGSVFDEDSNTLRQVAPKASSRIVELVSPGSAGPSYYSGGYEWVSATDQQTQLTGGTPINIGSVARFCFCRESQSYLIAGSSYIVGRDDTGSALEFNYFQAAPSGNPVCVATNSRGEYLILYSSVPTPVAYRDASGTWDVNDVIFIPGPPGLKQAIDAWYSESTGSWQALFRGFDSVTGQDYGYFFCESANGTTWSQLSSWPDPLLDYGMHGFVQNSAVVVGSYVVIACSQNTETVVVGAGFGPPGLLVVDTRTGDMRRVPVPAAGVLRAWTDGTSLFVTDYDADEDELTIYRGALVDRPPPINT